MEWIAKIYYLFWGDLFTLPLPGGGAISIALDDYMANRKNNTASAGNSRRVIFLELFVDLQAIS